MAHEHNDVTHHRRHSTTSSASSWLPDSLHSRLSKLHQVTEIVEENEAGDGVAFQVPVFVSCDYEIMQVQTHCMTLYSGFDYMDIFGLA